MAGNVSMTVRRSKSSEDDLDFYPTAPWTTRALLDLIPSITESKLVWEPACGGGHMSQVLIEAGCGVASTDIYDYGYSGFLYQHDFLTESAPFSPDWIITNPPFKSNGVEKFAVRATSICPNVAILARLSWLEGTGRYDRLFRTNPPSLVAVIPERLGFIQGDCDVERRGMIPYAWYVWREGSVRTKLTWIPPGTRDRLTLPTDRARYGRPVVSVT